MTDEELLAEVKRLWAHWSGLLGLLNWRPYFEVSQEKGPGAFAVAHAPYYHKPTVTVYKAVEMPEAEFSPDILSGNVLHEVVHLLLIDLQNVMDAEFEADGLMFRRFRNALESSVDQVTSVIWRLHADT